MEPEEKKTLLFFILYYGTNALGSSNTLDIYQVYFSDYGIMGEVTNCSLEKYYLYYIKKT